MTEKIEHELLSRRSAFSLFGLAAAFSLALPVTLSALSDAEAQTAGMERRQDRREGRHERRAVTVREGNVRIDVRRGAVAEASRRAPAPVPAQSSSTRLEHSLGLTSDTADTCVGHVVRQLEP